jgi:hypothetical protein
MGRNELAKATALWNEQAGLSWQSAQGEELNLKPV